MKARDYQLTCVDKLMNYLTRTKDKHPIIALPTGAGKSFVIALIIEQLLEKNSRGHILVLSHNREILEQNAEAIESHIGQSVGVYSSGLNRKEIKKVTVAGIQSAYRNPIEFEKFKTIIIDECHLIPSSDNTMYRKFFQYLYNPRLIGLTATPFRLGDGLIYGNEEAIFDDMVYDLTSMDNFNKLVEDGYLCKLITRSTRNELDTNGVRTIAGDFDLKEMSIAFDREAITKACVNEMLMVGKTYNKWLIFAIDIDHAEHIAEVLNQSGIKAGVVHSKMEDDRDTVIQDFKAGNLRALVNVNVLTTGFNDPEIDLIIMMRPTKSPVIHVQTIGRGLRVSPKKDHCCILDFAGNTERLGPINDVRVSKKRKGEGGEPITKRCPDCDAIHHPTKKVCDLCGHVFKFKVGLQVYSTDSQIVATERQHWFKVDGVAYSKHVKPNRPPTVKVTYHCGLRFFSEYICLEHPGYAGHRAIHWVRFRGGIAKTVDELILDTLKQPEKIKVDTSKKYPHIVDYVF